MKKGSVIGNVAQDLGLDLKRLRSGRARIVSGENVQYVELNADKGTLAVNERIDREQLCGDVTPCSFTFEIILENPIELHRVLVEILDVNDHSPLFRNNHIQMEISESAVIGSRFVLESADDPDVGLNGLQKYVLSASDNFVLKQHANPDGSKFAEIILQKALDREDQPRLSFKLIAVDGGTPQRSGTNKQLQLVVKAQDGGSPPLSSNVTVKILVQDQNDNPPQVLYPVQTGGSVVAEMVPRSADVGYLVTKVVAVDVDSGQNAWLSLSVIVEDNGQPSRSATVIVNVAVADSFPEVLSEFTDFPHDKEYNDNLTFYLVLALAVVSFLFITSLVVIISVKIYRWRQSRVLYQSNLPVIPYYPPRYSDTLGTGTLQHVYNYEVCRTTDSRKSDMKYMQPMSQSLVSVDGAGADTVQVEKQLSDNCSQMSTLGLLRLCFGFMMDCTWTVGRTGLWQALVVILCLFQLSSVTGQARYSIPEEQPEGSFVGNIARDLGLDVARLMSGKARIIFKGSRQYVDLNRDKGTLVIKERIDREELCGKTTPCSFNFEVILENPIQLYRVTVEVTDINDNSPSFPKDEINLKIAENAAVGTRFSLESADDSDVLINDIQKYILKPSDNFKLEVQNQPDGGRFIEMVLQNPLDREKEESHTLMLIASDGGEPHRSGTVRIHITVLDANDNAPVCSQAVYKADVRENSPEGTVVTTVSANDADKGFNGEVTYSIAHVARETKQLFEVNVQTGEIKVAGKLDFEKSKTYQLNVQASDHGGFTDTCKVIIQIIDENDNVPTIQLMSFSNSISEDSAPGTTVAVVNVDDEDSDGNGVVKCSINTVIPFKIESSLTGYYSIVTDDALDRESVPEYNITITVSDQGSPPLSSSKSINVKVSDVNDNAPKFDESQYSRTVPENNSPGFSVFTLSASDADWGQNARVSYFLEEKEINGVGVSSLVSVSSENGVIHAVRSFDYEQIKWFEFNVTARDAGSPPLSSVATVKILVQDQNDNPPQVLYPVQTGGSVVAEMVPRSADVGYLVTKVVAVDVDSGQNAWLSYKLQKATDRALFEVGLQNGEIRTVRQVTDKDAVKQRLSVIVEDNGQPSRSATVIVNVAVADSFPEVLSEFTDFPHDKEYNDNLTFYLVLALAVVSFLFITSLVVIISVKIYRWRQSRVLYQSNLPVIPYYPPRYSDTLGTGTLQHVYNYEVCRTTDSRKSDCKFGRAGSQNVLIMDPSSTGTMQRIQSEKSILDEPDSPIEIRYSVPEEMKKGSLIGNVAQDLGLDLKRLRSGRARIVTGENVQYTELKTDKGILVVNERIDREQLCGDQHVNPDGSKYAEMVLQKQLDREDVPHLYLKLIAVDESGVVYAVRSFDYEQIKQLMLIIKAQDGGSPPLSSNVTVKILVQDQNDNPPQVLYPVQTGGSVVAEMVPRSADVGYLVTKVVAVDVDSGQNAWLSLSVIVEDNGQPSRSATVIVNVAVADSFPEVLSEFTDFPHDKEYNDNLTFYLVLALAVVSFLFITSLVVIISVKIYRWRQSRVLYQSNLPVIPYYPPRYSDTLGTGTLQHVYNYEF
ncbi:protocadherin gamma-A10-like [Mastacembelus armatus]|uniref:protocadherin gamma-A10-like n=1 Tax=Mastacembelus armatus TaxID=205130 RepID=UPI000E45DE02|nr:protocadherin gamma-A10-like [Mastacembelus armatus]